MWKTTLEQRLKGTPQAYWILRVHKMAGGQSVGIWVHTSTSYSYITDVRKRYTGNN